MSKRLAVVYPIAVAVVVVMVCCAPHMVAQGKGAAAEKAATSPEKNISIPQATTSVEEKKTSAGEKATSIAEKTKSMERMAGYFNIYWDATARKLWLEIDKWGTEFLYQSSMPAGIGSNDIVLDPRSSFFGISYMDYATPISESIVKRFAARHRLEKKDPSAAVSEAGKPIVY